MRDAYRLQCDYTYIRTSIINKKLLASNFMQVHKSLCEYHKYVWYDARSRYIVTAHIQTGTATHTKLQLVGVRILTEHIYCIVVCTHTHTHMHTHTHTHTHMHTHTHTHTNPHTCMHACMHMHTYAMSCTRWYSIKM